LAKKIEILFYALEELSKQNIEPKKTKLSDKYKGIISKEQGEDLNKHIKQMRSEWNSI
jgi:thioredoxin reductase